MIHFEDKTGTVVIVDLEFIPAGFEPVLVEAAAYPGTVRGLLGRLRAGEAAWNETVTPAQLAIGGGDFYRRTWDGPLPGEDGQPACVIYGRAWFREELAAREAQLGAGPAEIDALLDTFDEGMRRGWRYGRSYSAACPEGELGWHHAATLEPVTRAEYQAAAEQGGWPG